MRTRVTVQTEHRNMLKLLLSKESDPVRHPPDGRRICACAQLYGVAFSSANVIALTKLRLQINRRHRIHVDNSLGNCAVSKKAKEEEKKKNDTRIFRESNRPTRHGLTGLHLMPCYQASAKTKPPLLGSTPLVLLFAPNILVIALIQAALIAEKNLWLAKSQMRGVECQVVRCTETDEPGPPVSQVLFPGTKKKTE
ncbi:hypothetical protein HPB48_025096 [Haemaphysalis longicornis]|uniref:Uncharacterized protein n=1 Tax=Haemaphysalis longicornis TaxID=44386 RepID=A0A9J6H8E0_HAELO|nr:hypothetical protein HPB48_025096 [Haemaphysalis longicornis]